MHLSDNDLQEEGAGKKEGVGYPQTLQGTGQGQPLPRPPYRVSNLESNTRLKAWDDLVVETSGIEG